VHLCRRLADSVEVWFKYRKALGLLAIGELACDRGVVDSEQKATLLVGRFVVASVVGQRTGLLATMLARELRAASALGNTPLPCTCHDTSCCVVLCDYFSGLGVAELVFHWYRFASAEVSCSPTVRLGPEGQGFPKAQTPNHEFRRL
jgi:hypothetical protein